MINVENFIKETKQYFRNRGWGADGHDRILFSLNKDNKLHLTLSYFNTDSKANNPLYLQSNMDCPDIIKYSLFVFEHIKPLWVKYNMGVTTIECHYNVIDYALNCVLIDINEKGECEKTQYVMT